MSVGITLTSWSVRVSMMYALFARVPPVTTYRPSGDIITMCGFTLFPRNTLLIILLVLISMNPMSFESRLTIITTEVGSVILTPCASMPMVAAAAAPAAMRELRAIRRATLNMTIYS